MARTNNALRTVFNAVKRFGGLNLILMQSTFTTVLTLFLIWAPPGELPGLHNVHQAATNVYLGSEPHGEEAFAELQKLGVTTIVSVDGAQPDVAAASKFGIRYVHIPIGYDGIGTDAAKSLTRVARDIESPIYVHCHHGKQLAH